MNQPTGAVLHSPGIAGTAIRSAFVLVLSVLAGLLAWGGVSAFGGVMSPRDLMLVVLAIGGPMVMGVFASEYPPGVEFVFLRLASATFCRTGLPLLMVLLLDYLDPDWLERMVVPIVAVYAAGFITSVLLSVSRLNAMSSTTSETG